jgi:hypothetical protein
MVVRMTKNDTPVSPVYARRASVDKTSDDARLLPTPLRSKGGRNGHRDVELIWEWIKSAKIGQQCCYHIGQLIIDCESFKNSQTKRKQFARQRREAQKYAAAGMVYLVQRKVEKGAYEYLAVRAADGSKTWWE